MSKTAWEGGPTYDITTDAATKTMTIKVTVPKNMYFGLAFGKGMYGVDNLWFSNTLSGVGTVKDMWATSERAPVKDTNQNFKMVSNKTDKTTLTTTFVVTRPLNTGDTEQDTVIECGKDHEFEWVGNSQSSVLQMHNKDGDYTINLNEDCSSGASINFLSSFAILATVASSIY